MTLYIGDDDDLDGSYDGDDIVGDDDGLEEIFGTDIIGADNGTAALQNRIRKLTAALKVQRVTGNKKIVSGSPKIMRLQILPLPVTNILHTATETVSAQPQRDFRVERLIVPSFCARYFSITSFTVGQDNQFVAAGEVSAQAFSEVAVGSRLEGNTANIGNLIVLTVKNIDTTNDYDFYSSISGTTLTNG